MRPEWFWSLAFASTPPVHERIGGFDVGFEGYGAEDTDYGLRAHAAGVPSSRGSAVPGPTTSTTPSRALPVEHLDDIVRNARRFRAPLGTLADGGLARRLRGCGPRAMVGPARPSRRSGP